jgi:ATP-binding cassette subfamily E protein 1
MQNLEKNFSRIGIISQEKCKPSKCKLECKNYCPVVRMGKFCIQIDSSKKIAKIEENLCIGCGICIKKCPFGAIKICNFPKELGEKIIHQFGKNSFRLFRLPTPKPGQILGLIGVNGIGKSTALKILAGKIRPNIGLYDDPPEWKEIIKKFRGNELQNFFNLISKNKFKIAIKPQYIESISENIKGTIKDCLEFEKLSSLKLDEIIKKLSLDHIIDKNVKTLSGGELQRFAISIVSIQKADIFLFDELTSYLDVKQRIESARIIRNIMIENPKSYMILVEHDLAIIDFISDFICCFYGKPGAYGIVTLPYTVKEGINIYLSGTIPTENLKFRDNPLNFNFQKNDGQYESKNQVFYNYPRIEKKLDSFRLTVEEGFISKSEIIVLLGENGSGKTSFVKIIANILKPDENCVKLKKIAISYKPQKISPIFEGTVKKLISEKLEPSFVRNEFKEKIFNILKLTSMYSKKVENLSGGELQRLAIALCLVKNAEIYLIDEPSAYLDLEQRINVAKIIKNFITEEKKASFVVEHDFILSSYIADKIIVFEKKGNNSSSAGKIQSITKGMNLFLKDLEITFRRDSINYRPRINKYHSIKDREQKERGEYFF